MRARFKKRICQLLYMRLDSYMPAHFFVSLFNVERPSVKYKPSIYTIVRFLKLLERHSIVTAKRPKNHNIPDSYKLKDPSWTITNIELEIGGF